MQIQRKGKNRMRQGSKVNIDSKLDIFFEYFSLTWINKQIDKQIDSGGGRVTNNIKKKIH